LEKDLWENIPQEEEDEEGGGIDCGKLKANTNNCPKAEGQKKCQTRNAMTK